MKVGILAGGLGTRISEETEIKPKPMAEIGGNRIIWHVMKHYECYGYTDFSIALGYRSGEQIQERIRSHKGWSDIFVSFI